MPTYCGWWSFKSLALTQSNPAFERLGELLVYNGVALLITLFVLALLWLIVRLVSWVFA